MTIKWEMLGDLGKNFTDGYAAGRKLRQEEDQRTAMAGMASDLAAMFGGDGGASQSLASLGAGAAPYTTATAAGATSMRAPADPEIETRFVSTLRGNGLTNPNALAAVAAYANAESGYSPKNITGSWSDPSESGQAGTSGGILSWRADRLANMRKFTAGAQDPVAAQAMFFLSENPALTSALQNAKSPEEAASLMAGAWKFAGWDRPGGENARRTAMARNYLGRVSGGERTARADMPDAGARPIEFAPGDQPNVGFIIPPGPQGPQGVDPNRSGAPTLAMLGQLTQGGYGARETPPQAPYSALQSLGDPSGADPSFSPGAGGMGGGPTPSSAAVRFPGAGTPDDRARTMSMDPLGPLASLRPPERPVQPAAAPPLPPRRPAMVEASAYAGETLPEVVVPPSSTSGAPQRVVRRNPAAQVARPVQEPGIPADERGRVQPGAGYGNNDRDGGALAFATDPSTAPAGYGPAQLPGAPMYVSNPMGGVPAQAPMRSPVPAIPQGGAPVTRQAAVEAPLPPARPSDLGMPPAAPGTPSVATQGAPGADQPVKVPGYDGAWTRATAPGDGRGPSAAEVAAAQRGGAPASAAPAPSEPAAAAPARAPNGMPNWQTTDQVPQPVQGAIGRANISKLIAWTANPNLPAGAREVASMFLKRALDESKAPDSVKEFMWARANGMTTATSPNAYAREKKESDAGDKIREESTARQELAAQYGLQPGTPAYQSFVLTGKTGREDRLSGAELKAVMESDDAVNAAEGTITALRQAKELSRKAWSGPVATYGAGIGSFAGAEGAIAAKDMDNLVTSNALSQLKSIFGGNPTEGERKILLDIQGSSAQPDVIRQKIFDRAEAAVQRRLGIMRQRGEELRGGSYFKPGGGQAPGRQSAPQAQADEAPSRAAPAARAPASVPGGAVQALRSNPGLAAQFDAKYGPGASAQYLGGQ